MIGYVNNAKLTRRWLSGDSEHHQPYLSRGRTAAWQSYRMAKSQRAAILSYIRLRAGFGI